MAKYKMNIKKWITINSNKCARLTHMQPNIAANEVSILLDINLPDELFRKPRLEAKIEIPKEAVGPDVLNSKVVENVSEAIKQSTGLTFAINVVREENSDDKS